MSVWRRVARKHERFPLQRDPARAVQRQPEPRGGPGHSVQQRHGQRGDRRRRRGARAAAGRAQAVRDARGADRRAVRAVAHRHVWDLLPRLQPDDQIREHDQLPGEGAETFQRRGDGDDRARLKRRRPVGDRSSSASAHIHPRRFSVLEGEEICKNVSFASENGSRKTEQRLKLVRKVRA